MGIFGDKEKGKLVLVFDIGSSFVGGAIFLMQESGVPKIIATVREPITLQKTFDVDKFLSSTLKSLRVVVEKIYFLRVGAPKDIFCILSSPWHVSQSRIIKLEKNTPFLFTSKLVLGLIQKEISLFKEEYLTKYGVGKDSVRAIEFKNIKTMLNGYETQNPLDQKTKELEMTIFVSLSSEQVLKKIEETIRSHFHMDEIKFSSFSMASFAVARDMYAHNEDFLLIDINGEVTDISMVKKNILRESTSFPLGLNFIMRGVSSFAHCPFGEAKSLFSLFKDGHATATVAKKLTGAVDKLKTKWLMEFQKSLANLSSDVSIPASIYLVTDQGMADFFCETIKAEQFNQYILTESKFKVVFLDAKVFHGLALFGENAVRDPFLIIDSIYINRFLNKI